MRPQPSKTRRLLLSLALLYLAVPACSTLPLDKNMDTETARSMLNRFGYGVTPDALEAAVQQTPVDYLTRAIQGKSGLPASVEKTLSNLPIAKSEYRIWKHYGWSGTEISEDKVKGGQELNRIKKIYLNSAVQARLLTMANSDNQGHEILLSFWLNHFSVYGLKKHIGLVAWDYAKTLEDAMEKDSFLALLQASFYHPTMQLYLDNETSTGKNSKAARNAKKYDITYGLNENLARELLELHTLGINAGYTQKDVQELARIISGSSVYTHKMTAEYMKRTGTIRKDLYVFDPRRHDYGQKNLLGIDFPHGQGFPEIDRALIILAQHPLTARHISYKLAQRFLTDNPPGHIVDAMSKGYLESGGKISSTLLPLLQSAEFHASLKNPEKFKEPLDYLLSYARAVCGDTPINNGFFLGATSLEMRQTPFMQTTPDGYGATEADWLSPHAIARRILLATNLSETYPPIAEWKDTESLHLTTLTEKYKKELLEGQACQPNLTTVKQAVGKIPRKDLKKLKQLNDLDKMRFLLSSHTFMYR